MAKKTTWKRRDSIQKLNTIIEGSIEKYNYKLCRYLNDISIDLRAPLEYSYFSGYGFDLNMDADLFKSPSTNVSKSVIDSLVSKLSNNKVRPFFTPVDSNYKTKQIIKEAQKYFDAFFDNQDIHSKVSAAFKSACVFDKGYLFINPLSYEIEQIPTWCCSVLSSEESYGNKKPTRMLIKYLNYPTTKLPEYLKYSGNVDYIEYAIYVDIESHEITSFLNGREVHSEVYKPDVLPLITIYYNEPLFGNRTVSVIDELDGIQTQIDLINAKISTCSQLTPGNVTYVNEGSSITAADITNRDGAVYRLDMPPGVTTLPVENVTPAPVDPMWTNLLDYYTQKAYDMVGISALSAQSRKPSGLDSGAALETMENIESDRFETQTTHYINAYTDLTKILIKVFPDESDIMPDGGLKWADVKKESELFNIQYSSASALSKDPSTKLQQIMQMSQAGLIPTSKIGQYLELPDLEDVYSGAAAVQNAVDKVIELCLEENKLAIPNYVSYELLAQEITQTQNELYGSLTGDFKKDKENIEKLERLSNLDEKLTTIMEEEGFVETTEPEEQMVSDSGIAVGGTAGGIQAPSAVADVEGVNTDLISTEENLAQSTANNL